MVQKLVCIHISQYTCEVQAVWCDMHCSAKSRRHHTLTCQHFAGAGEHLERPQATAGAAAAPSARALGEMMTRARIAAGRSTKPAPCMLAGAKTPSERGKLALRRGVALFIKIVFSSRGVRSAESHTKSLPRFQYSQTLNDCATVGLFSFRWRTQVGDVATLKNAAPDLGGRKGGALLHRRSGGWPCWFH